MRPPRLRDLRRRRRPLIDRAPQHLPLAVGTLATAHRERRSGERLRLWLGRRYLPVSALAGSILALVGASLSAARPAVEVYRSGMTVHVGESVLTAVPGDPETFTGDGALVLRRDAVGGMRAAASMSSGGSRRTGWCVMPPSTPTGARETCEFRLGSRHLSATDRLEAVEGSSWHRRYDDGGEITIRVPPDGGVIPVPFPIGR